MSNMPFKVLVDEVEMPDGLMRVEGNTIKVAGRSNREFQCSLLSGQDPDYIHSFHLFSVPLPYHKRWRDTLKDGAFEIDDRYFGIDGFLIGRNSTSETFALQPDRLNRIHYVGRDNGFPADNAVQGSCGYYTLGRFSDKEARPLVGAFSIQEILYLGLLQNGIALYEIPDAVGKKIKVDASLDLPGERTNIEFLVFHFTSDISMYVTRDGIPFDNLPEDSAGFLSDQKRQELVEYLRS